MNNQTTFSALNIKRGRSKSRSGSNEKLEIQRKVKLAPEKDKELMEKVFKIEENKKINCESCKKNLTKTIRIACADCKNIEFCVDCLISQAESNTHNHDYHIIDKMFFPILTDNWTAYEELQLLTGILIIL